MRGREDHQASAGAVTAGPSRIRLRVALLVGAGHLGLQVVLYAVAFAVGPAAATARNGGLSLYRIAQVLTFPVVWLAERYAAWVPPLGPFYLAVNSALWAAAAWALFALFRLPRRP